MSLLEVNKITPQSGTTLTLGDTGDTINFGSGVLPNFENLTVTGDLTVDTNSLKVDSTNNYVGIGTASPNKPLHIETTGETVARIVGGTTSITGLYLGDSGNGSAGQVIYDNNGDYLRFNTSSTERVRITSAGNVGIGTSSPNSKVDIRGTGAVTLNVGSTDGTTARLTLDATNGDASGGDFPLLLSDGSDLTIEANNSTNDAEIILRNNSSDAMRIDSSGNVGIGTSAPAHNVEIVATASGSINDSLQIRNNATATGTGSRIRFINSTDKNSDTNGASIASVRNGDDNDLVFEAENSEAMRIDHAGLVGIGTSSPQKLLHVSGGGTTPTLTTGDVIVAQNNANTSDDCKITVISGTSGTSRITFGDADDSDIGKIKYNHSNNSLIFDTDNTERMRIDSSGNVGMGTGSPNVSGLEISRATGSASPTPSELRLTTSTNASDWSTTSPYARVSFYSNDTSSSGPKIMNSIDAITTSTTGAISNLVFKSRTNKLLELNEDISYFYTGNTERMRIESSGNLLIGQSSTGGPGVGNTTSGHAFQPNGRAVHSYQSGSTAGFFSHGTDGALLSFYVAGTQVGYLGTSSSGLTFATNGSSERVRIDSSGNVGIGTTSPSAQLHVNDDTHDGITAKFINSNAGNSGAEVELIKDSSSPAANDNIGAIKFLADDSTGIQKNFASIQSVTISATAGSSSGDLRFSTRASNNTAERMRIDSSGNLGIGTTGPLEKLDVAGNIVGTGGQNSSIECGRGTGSVAMTVNDGGGNANLTFNHRSETPDVSGNAGRIQVNVDSSSGSFMSFGVKSNVTQNTQVAVPIVFTINESGVSITGSLSKSSGSFRIPHPLSSKTNTHDLVHSFIEAPQADNIYRGKVDLVNGTATVNIDTVAGMSEGTFVLLNREIQCFTSNETGWTAVKGSVSGNTLTIIAQDNTCTDTISWLVIGERQDQHMYDTEWTDENGKVIVEPLKPIEEEALENA